MEGTLGLTAFRYLVAPDVPSTGWITRKQGSVSPRNLTPVRDSNTKGPCRGHFCVVLCLFWIWELPLWVWVCLPPLPTCTQAWSNLRSQKWKVKFSGLMAFYAKITHHENWWKFCAGRESRIPGRGKLLYINSVKRGESLSKTFQKIRFPLCRESFCELSFNNVRWSLLAKLSWGWQYFKYVWNFLEHGVFTCLFSHLILTEV